MEVGACKELSDTGILGLSIINLIWYCCKIESSRSEMNNPVEMKLEQVVVVITVECYEEKLD